MTFIGLLMMHNNISVIKNVWAPPPATLDLPVSMVVLREAQAIGLDPHLSNIHLQSRKSLNICTWSSVHRNRNVVMHHQEPYESH
jgi:hypothetical protein